MLYNVDFQTNVLVKYDPEVNAILKLLVWKVI